MYAFNLTFSSLLIAQSTLISPMLSTSASFNKKRFDMFNSHFNHCFSTIFFASSFTIPILIKKSQFTKILDNSFKISGENKKYFDSQKYSEDIYFDDSNVTYHNCLFEECTVKIIFSSWFYSCFFFSCGKNSINTDVINCKNTNLISCIFENNQNTLNTEVIMCNYTRFYKSKIGEVSEMGINGAIINVRLMDIYDVNFTSNQAAFGIDNSVGKTTKAVNRVCFSYNKFISAFYLGKAINLKNSVIYNNDCILFYPSIYYNTPKVPIQIEKSCIFSWKNCPANQCALKFSFSYCNFNSQKDEVQNGVFDNCRFGVSECEYAEDMTELTPIPERKYFAYNIIGDVVETFAYQ